MDQEMLFSLVWFSLSTRGQLQPTGEFCVVSELRLGGGEDQKENHILRYIKKITWNSHFDVY